MSSSSGLLKQLAREVTLLPQEEVLDVGRRRKSLFIGIPKETSFQEHRVPLTPQSVAVLPGRGHQVVIERDTGRAVQFQDSDYQRGRRPKPPEQQNTELLFDCKKNNLITTNNTINGTIRKRLPRLLPT